MDIERIWMCTSCNEDLGNTLELVLEVAIGVTVGDALLKNNNVATMLMMMMMMATIIVDRSMQAEKQQNKSFYEPRSVVSKKYYISE
jgi:hypothetical protein